MKLLNPITVTDAILTSHTVPENDAVAYAADVVYAQGHKVIHAHRIYESAQANNVGHPPATSPDWWTDMGPTNRWAMFDRAVGTITKTGQSLETTLQPGFVNSMALLETQAATATVRITVGAQVIFERTYSFEAAGFPIIDWYQYFFAPAGRVKSLVMENLPVYDNSVVSVRLVHESQVQCGVLLMGTLVELGDTMSSPTVSFTDYSRKDTNSFGATDIVERAWAKKASVQIKVPTGTVDSVMDSLAAVRARPVLYVGGGRFDWLNLYGLCRRAEMNIEFVDFSYLTMDLEGLI